MMYKFTGKFIQNLRKFCDHIAEYHSEDKNYSSRLYDYVMEELDDPESEYKIATKCNFKMLGKIPSGSGTETPENKKLKKFEITKFPKASEEFYKPKNPLARIYY